MRKIRTLKGNSGCMISLYESHKRNFVRKTCESREYETRFFAQIKKLLGLTKIAESMDGTVFFPEIYDVGRDKHGKLYYDMQFINGESFCQFVNHSSINESLMIFDLLLGWIHDMSKQKQNEEIDVYQSVIEKLWSLDSINFDVSLLEGLSLKKTAYHGDLTFENILIENKTKRIFLIDPMETYIEHAAMDLSKLCTDIFGFWSNRNTKAVINPGIYSAFRTHAMNTEIFQTYNEILRRTVMIDLLRTLPYLKNEMRFDLVNDVKSLVEGGFLW